ncbi:hypothetical protein BC828DRAFT_375258 [Blastocladiella britannica]|nr:hypothetical protein BC828DRAFT_375258 [Blastocladiella britannica]
MDSLFVVESKIVQLLALAARGQFGLAHSDASADPELNDFGSVLILPPPVPLLDLIESGSSYLTPSPKPLPGDASLHEIRLAAFACAIAGLQSHQCVSLPALRLATPDLLARLLAYSIVARPSCMTALVLILAKIKGEHVADRVQLCANLLSIGSTPKLAATFRRHVLRHCKQLSYTAPLVDPDFVTVVLAQDPDWVFRCSPRVIKSTCQIAMDRVVALHPTWRQDVRLAALCALLSASGSFSPTETTAMADAVAEHELPAIGALFLGTLGYLPVWPDRTLVLNWLVQSPSLRTLCRHTVVGDWAQVVACCGQWLEAGAQFALPQPPLLAERLRSLALDTHLAAPLSALSTPDHYFNLLVSGSDEDVSAALSVPPPATARGSEGHRALVDQCRSPGGMRIPWTYHLQRPRRDAAAYFALHDLAPAFVTQLLNLDRIRRLKRSPETLSQYDQWLCRLVQDPVTAIETLAADLARPPPTFQHILEQPTLLTRCLAVLDVRKVLAALGTLFTLPAFPHQAKSECFVHLLEYAHSLKDTVLSKEVADFMNQTFMQESSLLEFVVARRFSLAAVPYFAKIPSAHILRLRHAGALRAQPLLTLCVLSGLAAEYPLPDSHALAKHHLLPRIFEQLHLLIQTPSTRSTHGPALFDALVTLCQGYPDLIPLVQPQVLGLKRMYTHAMVVNPSDRALADQYDALMAAVDRIAWVRADEVVHCNR